MTAAPAADTSVLPSAAPAEKKEGELLPVPRHVAVIMDGNGRWARQRGLPRNEGHKAGAESIAECLKACEKLGVDVLTLYTFSSENWNRPKMETDFLMDQLERYLREKRAEFLKRDVRFRAIGRLQDIPARCRALIEQLMEETRHKTRYTLVVALSYGARQEIVEAARVLAEKVRAGDMLPEEIDEHAFSQHLHTADLPDPDLLIRTSGEMRVSNFLLWQISYAELFVSEKLWPDFKEADFLEAVANYRRRRRRFGAL